MFKTIVYFLKIIKFMETVLNKEISIAPMMKWTDRHCRFFHRQFSKSILLYTEMISSNAVMFGNRKKLLAYNDEEHPVAIQLGGSNPSLLGDTTRGTEEEVVGSAKIMALVDAGKPIFRNKRDLEDVLVVSGPKEVAKPQNNVKTI